MIDLQYGPQIMPKTYSNQQQRYATFKRLYWNSVQQRVMWQRVNNQKNVPVVLISIPKATGTSYHRVQQPVRRIVNKYPNDYIFVYAEPASIADVLKCDILQLHRSRPCHDAIYNFFRKLNKSVKRPIIVNNIDDLQYEIPRTHYLYQQWMDSHKDKMSKRMFNESDYNLITSWNYQKILQRDIGFSVINGKTYRFANYIDYQLPQWGHGNRKRDNKKIVIGWIGLVSHNIDLIYIHNIWKPLSQKYGDKIEFVISLPNPQFVEFQDRQAQLSFSRSKKLGDAQYGFNQYVKQLFGDIKKSNIRYLDAVPLSQYGKLYRQLDISFIVVQPTKFNRAKSQIKITQSVFNRCIPVYNNFGPYAQYDEKVRNYIKVKYGNDPQGIEIRKFLNNCSHNTHDIRLVKSWVSGLSQLVDRWSEPRFVKARQDFLQFLYQFNINEYGLYENVDKRKAFYDEICKKHNIKIK